MTMPSLQARESELIDLLRRRPDDRIAWHNLAAVEGDLGRPAQAEAAARRAIELGLPAAETRLVLARALQSLRRLDAAESVFEDALLRQPAYVEAHRDYAQLVWMRTGDRAKALARLDGAVAVDPANAELQLARSLVLEAIGDTAEAFEAAQRALSAAPGDVRVVAHAAHLASLQAMDDDAIALARRAAAGGDLRSRIVLCEALIAAGRNDEASREIDAVSRAAPLDQYVVALRATLWRISGDARYDELCDYDSMIGTMQLEPPSGYASLEGFLAAVAGELDVMHGFVSHPFHQSVRAGSQLTFHNDDFARPLVRDLFASIRSSVERYLVKVGRGTDPFRSRNTARPNFTGAWSIRLLQSGSHVDHVHPHGWLSSACYIALPSTIGSGDDAAGADARHAGWLRFGRPGLRMPVSLPAERFVAPVPGRMVLFPAYMWHGVEPFAGSERRLTVAFDVIPG